MTLLDRPTLPDQAHLEDVMRRADQTAARLQIQVRAARLEGQIRMEALRARQPLDAGVLRADVVPSITQVA